MADAISNLRSETHPWLEEALGYQNDDVVERYAEEFGYSVLQSQAIFEETKKWLWLCGLQSLEGSRLPLTLFDELLPVDLMWHTFILFTHDYADFCNRFCGTFVHHVPRTKRSETLSLEKQKERIQYTYEFIFDYLGAETLIYWCEVLPITFEPLITGR